MQTLMPRWPIMTPKGVEPPFTEPEASLTEPSGTVLLEVRHEVTIKKCNHGVPIMIVINHD